jgi:23S rRNA (adenine2503-C2)-methyltransferase
MNETFSKTGFCGSVPEDLTSRLPDIFPDREMAVKVATSFYRKNNQEFSTFHDITKETRKKLESRFTTGLSDPAAREISADLTVKYLFRNDSGLEFETVVIPEKNRKTVCVSTQAGCRMDCPFCLTGKSGFRGNLSAGDIVNQVMSVPGMPSVTHIVFMGMGEPLDNLDAVLKACRIFTEAWGLAISPGNITLSSVGILPAVNEFLERTECNFTISLYSPFPEEREEVVPAERLYPVSEIIELLRGFPARKKRRFSAAYVMIDGINDSNRHLEGLKKLLGGSRIRVNLLPYHNAGNDKYISSGHERMNFFRHNLVMAGISASVRRSRGTDISAACGLLAAGMNRKYDT